MPTLTVRVFATLRQFLGWKTPNIDAPVDDVGELIKFIADRFQPSFKDVLIDPKSGQVRRTFLILVDGRDIAFLEGLRTKLKEGDTIAFFPPVAGG
jgi:molybdopterin synthase sulfur carrier subunit